MVCLRRRAQSGQGTNSKDAEGGPALSGLWSTIPSLKNQLQLLLLPAPAPLAPPPPSISTPSAPATPGPLTPFLLSNQERKQGLCPCGHLR